MATSTYTVIGMSCDHCVNAVKTELGKIDGVTGVDVELSSGRVRIDSDALVSDTEIAAAIDEAGYELAD